MPMRGARAAHLVLALLLAAASCPGADGTPAFIPKVSKEEAMTTRQPGGCCQYWKSCNPADVVFQCFDSDLQYCAKQKASAWGPKCKACMMCNAFNITDDPVRVNKITAAAVDIADDDQIAREACIPAAGNQPTQRKLLYDLRTYSKDPRLLKDPRTAAGARWTRPGPLAFKVCGRLHFVCVKYLNTYGQCRQPEGGTTDNLWNQMSDKLCFWCKSRPSRPRAGG